MAYQLGIDLGTTYTAAAIHTDGRVQIVELGNRTTTIPSVIFLTEGETILTGEAAERRALTEGHRVARQFKRRLGDPTPLLLGGTPYSAESLMSKLFEWVVAHVAEREGGEAQAITISYPANWGPYKRDLLDQAIRLADVGEADVVTEPEAAAAFYASQERVEPGTLIAVYDLGGGTFDAAVLRKTNDGFEVLGEPEGIERLGGIDFDEAVFAHVAQSLGGALDDLDADDPNAIAAVARLREQCVDAKEGLSSDTEISIPVMLPNVQTEVRLTRVEFEAMIRPSLAESISAMRRAVRTAGLEMAEIDRVLLVGGSSRIPLVAQLVGAELGRPVVVDAHPKHAIAQGAALLAAGARLTAAPPLQEPPVVAAARPPGESEAPAAPAAMPVGGDEPPSSRDLLPPMPAKSRGGRSRVLAIVGGLALVAIIAAAAVVSNGNGDDEGETEGETAAGELGTTTPTTAVPSETTIEPEVTAAPTTVEISPTPTSTLFPADTRTVQITDVSLDGDVYTVTYETNNYEPEVSDDPGSHHIHFFWDIYPPETVGTSAAVSDQNPWVVWDTDSRGRKVFDQFAPGDVPNGASEICAVVANFEHEVHQPEIVDLTVSCFGLP